jgi:hypothetical protein
VEKTVSPQSEEEDWWTVETASVPPAQSEPPVQVPEAKVVRATATDWEEPGTEARPPAAEEEDWWATEDEEDSPAEEAGE